MLREVDRIRFFDALQTPVVVIDSSYHISDANTAFYQAYGVTRADVLGQPCHEVTHHLAVPCWQDGQPCPLKNALDNAASLPCRLVHRHVTADGGHRTEEVCATALVDEGGRVTHIVEELHDVGELLHLRGVLNEVAEELNVLRGLVHMCANCHKVRDDEGNWRRVEEYLREHTEAQVSHGVCPECARLLYPEYVDTKVCSPVPGSAGPDEPKH